MIIAVMLVCLMPERESFCVLAFIPASVQMIPGLYIRTSGYLSTIIYFICRVFWNSSTVKSTAGWQVSGCDTAKNDGIIFIYLFLFIFLLTSFVMDRNEHGMRNRQSLKAGIRVR